MGAALDGWGRRGHASRGEAWHEHLLNSHQMSALLDGLGRRGYEDGGEARHGALLLECQMSVPMEDGGGRCGCTGVGEA